MMTLSTRLDLERGNRKPSELTELNLDNSKATEIEGLTDDYSNLQSLSLINVGLATLKGFPSLTNLKKLELSDNRITGGLNNLSGCPHLEQLSLSGNKIKDLESLKELSSLKCLRTLDLFNCEVTAAENYRKELFTFLPHLKYLDGFDENNEEEPEDDDEEDEGDLDDDDDDEPNDLDDDDELDDEDDAIVEEEDTLDDDDLVGEEEEDDDDDEVGLSALQQDDLEDDNEDYAPENDETNDNDDDLGEEEEDEDGEEPVPVQKKGVKRKHADEEESNDASNGS